MKLTHFGKTPKNRTKELPAVGKLKLMFTPKDPDETVDYQISWKRKFRSDDKIISSDWVLDPSDTSGVQIKFSRFTNNSTSIWLSNGVHKKTVKLINTIETDGGRVFEQGVLVPVESTF